MLDPAVSKRLARFALALGFKNDEILKRSAAPVPYTVVPPVIKRPTEDLGWLDVDRRVGRPFDNDYWPNRKVLFVPLLLEIKSSEIVNFAVAYQDMFQKFFPLSDTQVGP